MKKIYQTKFIKIDEYGIALEKSFGNCLSACLASIFNRPLTDIPDIDSAEKLYNWTKQVNEGIAPIIILYDRPEDKIRNFHSGYWIAGVLSKRFKRKCNKCTSCEKIMSESFLFDISNCPWCGGSSISDGEHTIVMNKNEIIFDPHPNAINIDYQFISEIYWEVDDPSQL